MKTARVTMSRVMGGSESYVSISIDDEASSLGVIRVKMSLEGFASCVTGQGFIPGEVERWIGKNAYRIGMTRETRTMMLAGRPPYDKDEARRWVRAHPELILADGWDLNDDGTGTQQHDRTAHKISLARYVEATP